MAYIKLTKDERNEAYAAILDAFRNSGTLRRGVRNTGESLDTIVGVDGGLGAVVDRLVDWFEEKSRFHDLLRGLREENSDNQPLRDFEARYLAVPARRAQLDPSGEVLDLLLAVPPLQLWDEREKLLSGVPGKPESGRSPYDARADLAVIAGWLTKDASARRVVFGRLAREVRAYNAYLAERFVRLGGSDDKGIADAPMPAGHFAGKHLEQLAFDGEDARLPRAFLDAALRNGASVARLAVPRIVDGEVGKPSHGTGWLVAPRLVVTCDHVVAARDLEWEPRPSDTDYAAQALATVVRFDYYDDAGGFLEVAVEALVAWDAALDVALLRLAADPPTAARAPLVLLSQRPALTPRDRLNIIQHGDGRPQQYALRNNFYQKRSDDARLLWYLTDTMPGASGSPVFNDRWRVVALHHAARPAAATATSIDTPGAKTARFWNEGVDLPSIVDWLKEKHRPVWDEVAAAQGWAL
jgi:hypothetical protein